MRLVTVQGSMQLAAPAAAAWARLVTTAQATTGITPLISSPAGAFRSEALVIAMWLNPKKYGASQGTARPKSLGGGGSVHQNGLCVDINNWRQFGDLVLWRGFWRSRTLDNLCAAQGFYADPRYPNEPWHYQHTGTAPAGEIGDIPTNNESEEDDMRLLYVTDSVDGNNIPGWVLLNPRTGKTMILRADDPKNQERANSWAAVWGAARRCTRQELANAQAAIQGTN